MAVAFRALLAVGVFTLSSAAAAQTEQAPWTAPDDPASANPPPGELPPEGHYTEPPETEPAPSPEPSKSEPVEPGPGIGIHEPPPPGQPAEPPVHEPPPPPRPRHIAPRTAFWVGARLGWFVPFGTLWNTGQVLERGIIFDPVPWSDYASSGPLFEVDVGIRLGRQYNLFILWERAQLGSGDSEEPNWPRPDVNVEDPNSPQDGGETDFWALGLRANSDPDRVGLVTELAIGYRRFRASWEGGRELRASDAPFEARIGIGAEVRMNPRMSFSPMLTLGTGAFNEITDGEGRSLTTNADSVAGHYWFTIHVGGHFDIGGSG